ncbi:MAG: WD40 repeat domain-containing protein [Planctomycetota bacterium]|nr:WD40 repeat domain-containing protein [Planctomycetota bacterium]
MVDIHASCFRSTPKIRLLLSAALLAVVFFPFPRFLPAQELTAISGHEGGVVQSVFAPGGKVVISAGHDFTVKMWNPADATLLRSLEGHEGQVLSLAVSADGRRLLSGGRDNSIRVWDVFLPDPLSEQKNHEMAVSAVLVGPQGAWRATGSVDKTVKLLPPGGGEMISLEGHEAAITRLARNADGTMLASADATGQVRVWDSKEGALMGTFRAHVGPASGLFFHPTEPQLVTSGMDGMIRRWTLPLVAPRLSPAGETVIAVVRLSPDGKVAFVGDETSLRALNVEDAAVLRTFEGQQGAVASVMLNKDGTLVASGNAEGTIRFWKTGDGASQGLIQGHAGPVHAVAFHPTEPRGVSAGADGTIRAWGMPAEAQALEGHAAPVATVAVSPNGQLYATAGADKTVKTWNAADGALVQTIAVEGAGEVRSLAFQPDGTQLASGEAGGVIRFATVADGASAGDVVGHATPVTALAYRPDGKQLVSAGADGLVKWWDLPLVAPRTIATLPVAITSLATDGKNVVLGSADGSIRMMDPATGNQLRALAGHAGAVVTMALHPAGTQVASGQPDGAIRLFNAADGALVGTMRGHTGPVHAIALHPTLPHLVSGGADGSIRVWQNAPAPTVTAGTEGEITSHTFSADRQLLAVAAMIGGNPTIQVRNAANGQVTATFAGHAGIVTSLAISPDKTRLASGSADKTVRLWTIANAAAEPVVLEGHAATVGAVAFAANGTDLFSGAADNSIRQWKVADGTEVRVIAGHTGAISAFEVAGTTLVSSSADATVRLWNTASGAAIRSINHGAAVTSLGLAADGSRIASVGADKVIKLWTSADGAAAGVLQGHAGAVTSLAFSGDGLRVMSCGGSDLRVWSVVGGLLEQVAVASATASGVVFAPGDKGYLGIDKNNALRTGVFSLLRMISVHEGAVEALQLSADGSLVFSGGADKVVRRSLLADGAAQGTFTGATEPVTDLALSGDGMVLVASSRGGIQKWDLAAAAANQAYPATGMIAQEGLVEQVTLNMDGSRLLSADDKSVIRIMDVASGLELQQLLGHLEGVSGLYVSADGGMVLSVGGDKTLRQWTPAVGRVISAGEGAVTDLSWFPGSESLVLAGPDNLLRIWDQATAAVKHELPAGEKPLVSVATRKDGARIVAGGMDGNIYSWPVAAGVPGELAMVSTASPVVRVRFDAEGTRLVAASADKQLRVFDGELLQVIERVETAGIADAVLSADGSVVAYASGNNGMLQPLSVTGILRGHEGAVTSLAISADGSQLFSGGVDKTVRLWNLADGSQLGALAGVTGTVTALGLSEDGTRLVASSDDKHVRGWTISGVPNNLAADLDLEHPEAVLEVALAADKSRLVSVAADGLVRAWDSASGLILENFQGHEGAATTVSLGADNKTVVSGGADKTVRFWQVASEQVAAVDDEKVTSLVMLPDASQLGVIGSGMTVNWFDATGAPVRQLAGATAALSHLVVGSDGVHAAAADEAGKILVWTLANGTLVQTIETGMPVTAMAMSDDSTVLLVAGADMHLRAYDPAEGTLLQDQLATAPQGAVAFLPGTKDYLSADATGTVFTWAFASLVQTAGFTGHTAVYGVDFNAAGTLAASCGATGPIQIWNLETGAAERQLAGHEGAVYSVRFSADDKMLVSSSADGTVRVWNVEDGALVKSLAVPPAEGEVASAVFDAEFSPDGQLVAAGGSDGAIQLWNVASGEITRTIDARGEAIYRVGFSSGGNRLLGCGHAGTLTVTNVADGAVAFTTKLPSVAYSANYGPGGASIIASCANGNSYLVALPEAAR